MSVTLDCEVNLTVTFRESCNVYNVYAVSIESSCFLLNEKRLFCPVPDFFGLSHKTLNGFAISLCESRLQAQWPRHSLAFFWKHINNDVFRLYTSTQNYLCGSSIANLSLIAENLAISWCDASCLKGVQTDHRNFVLISPHWLGREAYVAVSSAETVDI